MTMMIIKYWIEKKLGIEIKHEAGNDYWRGEKRNTVIYARLDFQGWYISFNKEGKNVGLELNCHRVKDEKTLLKHINKFIRLSKCR